MTPVCCPNCKCRCWNDKELSEKVKEQAKLRGKGIDIRAVRVAVSSTSHAFQPESELIREPEVIPMPKEEIAIIEMYAMAPSFSKAVVRRNAVEKFGSKWAEENLDG